MLFENAGRSEIRQHSKRRRAEFDSPVPRQTRRISKRNAALIKQTE